MTDYAPPTPSSYAYPTSRPYNPLSIIGFVLAFVVPVAGIVCSHIALSQLRRSNEEGHGLALAGAIIGYVFTAITVALVVGWLIFTVALFSAGAGILGSVHPVIIDPGT